MYPLHLYYTTTLPCKTITIKITIFIIVLVLKSIENMEIWHFILSQLANSSKHSKNSLFQDVFKVSAPSLHTSSKTFYKAQYGLVDGVQWQMIPYCLQDFLQLVDGFGLGWNVLYRSSIAPQKWQSRGLRSGEFGGHSSFPMKSLQLVAIQFPLWKNCTFHSNCFTRQCGCITKVQWIHCIPLDSEKCQD